MASPHDRGAEFVVVVGPIEVIGQHLLLATPTSYFT